MSDHLQTIDWENRKLSTLTALAWPIAISMLSHSLMTLDVSVLITVLGAIGAVFAWVVDQRAGRQQERRQQRQSTPQPLELVPQV